MELAVEILTASACSRFFSSSMVIPKNSRYPQISSRISESFSPTPAVKTILSSHDFKCTPPENEIVSRLCRMQQLGADITKIAVMPQCKKDVLILLSATEQMQSKYADRTFITMSMGAVGSISRMVGEIFGSAVTFGVVNKSSAPGQIESMKLKQILQMIHDINVM